jgi:CBS domain-containing protein
MRARDVMTTEVVTAHPDASVRALAYLMVEHRISGLPVVDETGRLIGIVTGGDLYRRADIGTHKRNGHWLDLFELEIGHAGDHADTVGHVAGDVMTTTVIAVTPTTTLRQIAELFETKRIGRAPVLDASRLVGIVSRANLVQALSVMTSAGSKGGLSDQRVRDLVLAVYSRLVWGLPSEGNVIVTDGVVHVWGYLPSIAEVDVLRTAAEAVPGVKDFADHTYRYFEDVGARYHTGPEVILVRPADDP